MKENVNPLLKKKLFKKLNQKLKDIAIESALYIGYINGYELAGAKKLIR